MFCRQMCISHKRIAQLCRRLVSSCHPMVILWSNRKEKSTEKMISVHSTPILGLEACTKLLLVQRVEELISPPLTKEQILQNYSEVLTGLGSMDGGNDIVLDKTVILVIQPPRKVPYSILGTLKEKLLEPEQID